MSINCEIILQWSATPEQLTAVGSALWRWCIRVAGGTGIYQYLESQELTDLMAGKHPSRQTPERPEPRGVHFWVRDHVSHERQATIDSLRREVPAQGVEDILVDGRSWHRTEDSQPPPRRAELRKLPRSRVTQGSL